MANLVDSWHLEHKRFARLLDLFEAQLHEFQGDGSPDIDTMRDIVHYLHDYADRFHHPREDVAFAALVRHEPSLDPVIRRLLQEHRVIGHTSEALLGLLDAVAGDAMVSRADLEATAATYLAYYRNHLGTEERDILPRAARQLDAADWQRVAAALPEGPDPLFDAQIAERYRSLRNLIGA